MLDPVEDVVRALTHALKHMEEKGADVDHYVEYLRTEVENAGFDFLKFDKDIERLEFENEDYLHSIMIFDDDEVLVDTIVKHNPAARSIETGTWT